MEQFLKEAIILVVGKQAEPLADLLNSKNHVNEFIIAKKLDTTINHARNLLYKLAEFGLVSSIRKKDKKKGWYTYFWRLEQNKVLFFLRDILKKKLAELGDESSKREHGRYYVCETCKIELDEEKALLQDFTCNECGQIFSAKDNTKDLKEIIKLKERYNRELELIHKEIEEESEREVKKKVKEKVKSDKKKANEKAKNKKLKAKSQKKTVSKKLPTKNKSSAKKKKI